MQGNIIYLHSHVGLPLYHSSLEVSSEIFFNNNSRGIIALQISAHNFDLLHKSGDLLPESKTAIPSRSQLLTT